MVSSCGTAITLDKLRAAMRAIERADRQARERWAEWLKLTPAEQRELMARPLPLLPELPDYWPPPPWSGAIGDGRGPFG